MSLDDIVKKKDNKGNTAKEGTTKRGGWRKGIGTLALQRAKQRQVRQQAGNKARGKGNLSMREANA